MSLVINKTQLLEIIAEELQKAIREGYSLSSLNPEDWEEPQAHDDREEGEFPELEWPEGSEEEGDLRADTRLGGDWEGGAIDDEPAPRRPPKEYRYEAIKILVDLEVPTNQQIIDILAWELYRKAMHGPTQSMKSPPKKKKRFGFFEDIIREELEAYFTEKKTKVSKAGQKRVSQKIDAMTQAGECDDNPKQCQAIAYSYEERGKLKKQRGKKK